MPRFTFGPFELDLEGRMLRRVGEPVPIAGKTFDTLVLLLQNRGRPVDKEELLSRVWSDSVVEEANLTQSIFTVRKILGDSPKDHRYIATLAGRGYQFVAPVTESTGATEAINAKREQPSVQRYWNRSFWFSATGGLIIASTAVAFWLLRHSAREEIPPEPIPFTNGVGFASNPTFSPDGKEIAYSWAPENDASPSIYVKLMGTNTELQLTKLPGEDRWPAWSPDGRYIAFHRNLPGHSGYYMVAALGGPVRQLLEANTGGGLSWFPDGRRMAVVVGNRRAPMSRVASGRSSLASTSNFFTQYRNRRAETSHTATQKRAGRFPTRDFSQWEDARLRAIDWSRYGGYLFACA